MDLDRWSLWEIEYRRNGAAERPVTKELDSHGRPGERKRALGTLRLLVALGWPEAASSLEIEKVAHGVFLLKCKPGCWRMFFHVTEAERGFLLLHAVCKKTQKRKQNEPGKAARRLDDCETGQAGRCKVAL